MKDWDYNNIEKHTNRENVAKHMNYSLVDLNFVPVIMTEELWY